MYTYKHTQTNSLPNLPAQNPQVTQLLHYYQKKKLRIKSWSELGNVLIQIQNKGYLYIYTNFLTNLRAHPQMRHKHDMIESLTKTHTSLIRLAMGEAHVRSTGTVTSTEPSTHKAPGTPRMQLVSSSLSLQKPHSKTNLTASGNLILLRARISLSTHNKYVLHTTAYKE